FGRGQRHGPLRTRGPHCQRSGASCARVAQRRRHGCLYGKQGRRGRLTVALSEEVAKEGILVNAVAPSIMDTPANRAAMPKADYNAWPKVEEVAATICFLASPDNKVTRGGLVPVYGRAGLKKKIPYNKRAANTTVSLRRWRAWARDRLEGWQ